MTETEHATTVASTAVGSHALQIARTWAQLPPKHLEVALKALEPELQREHEHRLQLLRDAQQENQRRHVRYLCGLWAGFSIAVGMLTAAVVVGVNQQLWLAALLTGPSLLALAKLFVIRRADTADTTRITEAGRDVLANAPTSPPT